jgi:hypothetical protein
LESRVPGSSGLNLDNEVLLLSLFRLTPVRVPNIGQKAKASPKTNRISGLRDYLDGMKFGSQGLKVAVVLIFTLCWLLIILARSRAPLNPASFEGSSLVGLATAMQQGELSGRDFQSMYGPAAQILAWICTTLTSSQSPLDALGMMVFAFWAASAVLMAAVLLLCDRVSWQHAAVFYGFSIFLNLFYGVFDLRPVLLLLNVAFAYRVVAAETLSQRTIWAASAGLLCFVSQLVTFDLGIYASIAIGSTLLAGLAMARNNELLHSAGTFVATFATLNVALVAFFKLTSSGYALVFDYHNYGFEMLRGSHHTLGVLWQLPIVQTAALVVASLYALVVCGMTMWRSHPLDASLSSGLAVAAVLWVMTGFVQSDITHIAAAFTPMVVVLSFGFPRDWSVPKELVAWVVIAIAVILAWPTSSISAPADLMKVVRGEVGAVETFRDLQTTHRPLEETVKASLARPDLVDQREVPLLAFPFDTYIVPGVRRPVFAPVLETYAVSTPYLEDYYVKALQRRRRAGLEVLYGPDRAEHPLTGGVQAITRTPNVFEHIYKNFALVSEDVQADGHYVLAPVDEPLPVHIEPLNFSRMPESLGSGMVKLKTASTCGLIRVEMNLGYTRRSRFLRLSGVNVYLSDGDQRVWQGSIRALEPNQNFVTYISPLQPSVFHRVFGREPVPGVRWDKLEYRSAPTDLLGARATRVEIVRLECLDPQKFGEVKPLVAAPVVANPAEPELAPEAQPQPPPLLGPQLPPHQQKSEAASVPKAAKPLVNSKRMKIRGE